MQKNTLATVCTMQNVISQAGLVLPWCHEKMVKNSHSTFYFPFHSFNSQGAAASYIYCFNRPEFIPGSKVCRGKMNGRGKVVSADCWKMVRT